MTQSIGGRTNATHRGGTTWTGGRPREVKTGFCRKRWMQTGSSGTLIGWKFGQPTYFPLWDWMEGAWLWTQERPRRGWDNGEGLGHRVLTYVEYRTVSGVFQNNDPHPPFYPASVYSPAPKAGGYTLAGRWGGGGGVNILEDARHWTGHLQFNPFTGWALRSLGTSQPCPNQLRGPC